MAMLIQSILEVFNDYNKVICPGFYKAYLQARKKSQPVDIGPCVRSAPESEDFNFYLNDAQKMSAKYCADSLARLNGMPKIGSKTKLAMYTDQYMEGVITDWEYIERMVEAAEAAMEAANQLLYKNED